MKDKNIDQLFRDKLSDHEQQPPAYLLANVLTGAAQSRRRKKIVFWRIAGVAAALLLAFVAGWQLNYMNRDAIRQPMVENQPVMQPSHEAINVDPTNNTTDKNIHDSNIVQEETSYATDSDKNSQFASNINGHKKTLLPEKQVIDREAKAYSTQSIQPINRKIVPNDPLADRLHEKKMKSPDVNSQELTIDQQIMEQNRKQVLAQNEKRKKPHWLVGAQVSPAYSVNRSSHASDYANDMLNSSSNTPVELGGGLSVEYKTGKRWSLQSGVFYAGLGQSSGNSSVSNRQLDAFAESGAEFFNAPANIMASTMTVNSKAGVIELDGVPAGMELATNMEDKTLASAVVGSDARFVQNFQYLEIPLYLRYSLIDARFDVELMGGVSSNVLIGNDTYLENSTGKSLVGKTQGMQDISYSGTFGLGLKYGVSNRIFLNLEPRVKYYLNSLNTNSSVTYKPYTIGVYTGISYQF